MKRIYPLDPLYINERRVAGLVGSEVLSSALSRVRSFNEKQDSYLRSIKAAELLRDWMEEAAGELQEIERLLITTGVRAGQLFTYQGYLFSKNANGADKRNPSLAYVKLEELGSSAEPLLLQLNLHPDHVVSGSPGQLLSGKVSNLVVVAQCLSADTTKVTAVPIFIGYFREQGPLQTALSVRRNEVFVDDIDNFAEIKGIRNPSTQEISVLREIPEDDVKSAFAEIIGESDPPKDWGGERSDLFTTQLRIGGGRLSAAFAFKGPAGGTKFREMKLYDLGRNGDQIERLATEPAELLVIQHCHKISSAVKNVVRALCNQVGSERSYCLITGYDTYRILKAYRKCGL